MEHYAIGLTTCMTRLTMCKYTASGGFIILSVYERSSLMILGQTLGIYDCTTRPYTITQEKTAVQDLLVMHRS